MLSRAPAERKRTAEQAVVEEVEEEVGPEEGSDRKPKKPRVAKSPKQTAERMTAPSLPTLPFDVLHGISAFLDPGALLSLAQTSKSFRRTLLDRSSAPLWRAVRQHIGMPDLEAEGLSEPAYAALVFGECCQMCGTMAGKIRVCYFMRFRCCMDCLKTNLLTESDIKAYYPTVRKLAFKSAVQTLYSPGSDGIVKTAHYLVADVLAESATLRDLSAEMAFPIGADYDHEDENRDDDEILVDSVLADYLEQREEYKVKREMDMAELEELDAWLLDEEKLELARRQVARRRQIENKLAEYGHFIEDDYRHLYRSQAVFKSTEPLREVEWRKHRDKLVSAAQRNKNKRLAALRPLEQRARQLKLEPLFHERYAVFSPELKHLFPTFASWIDLASVQSLWKPDTAVVDSSTWPAVAPLVLADSATTARWIKVQLFDLIARALAVEGETLPGVVTGVLQAEPLPVALNGELAELHAYLPNAVLDPLLSRATALFRCDARGCGTKLPFPSIVEHVHRVHGSPRNGKHGVLECVGVPGEKWRRAVRAMVEGAARAIDTTTAEEMSELGGVFSAGVADGMGGTRELEGKTWAQITETGTPLWGVGGHATLVPEEGVVSLRIGSGC
ncbi:hypothetical protein JCM6882_002933 [Rhodosporidiobolus microsporus]